IAADTNGTLFVTDSGNSCIRQITPGGAVSTLAGSPGANGYSDGVGNAAMFHFPLGLSLDPAGNVLVADTDNQVIRKVTRAGVTTTLGGLSGKTGSDDGTGMDARFNYPEGVATGPDGTIYVADALNHNIRKGTPALPDTAT